MRFVPGCCTCGPPCCFSVKVYGCGAYSNGLPAGLRDVGVKLTEVGTGTVAMDGTTNNLGLVCNTGGSVIRVCPGSVSTSYTVTYTYASGNTTRMVFSIQPPGTTTIAFDGSASCPTGDAVFFIAVTPAS